MRFAGLICAAVGAALISGGGGAGDTARAAGSSPSWRESAAGQEAEKTPAPKAKKRKRSKRGAAEATPTPEPAGTGTTTETSRGTGDGETALAATTKVPPAASSGYSENLPKGGGASGYTAVPVDGPYVALTFDDGPHAQNTPRLLELLARKNVKATFFVVGQCVQEYPEIARRIVAEGHEIGNHSWSHANFARLSDAAVKSQLERTDEAIAATAGVTTKLLRPPYGSLAARQRKWLQEDLGLKIILWSVDPNDWKRPGAATVTRRIVAGAAPGAIILAHDIHSGTIDAMEATIDQLLARGFKLVTVSELLALERQATPPAPPPTPPPANRAPSPTPATPPLAGGAAAAR